ncbi:gamma-interferon-inducible lysosomal thiol reductase [Pseudophryne corroboree]|uniref:gamma-interferon-inducible lysosomal thiol reductase n=1 Tax=Pseudophryne corroboree TaxID=495146 RepID=UPI003081EDA9
MKPAVFLLMLCFVSASAEQQCNHSPSDWCSSWEIAKACQVEEQCLEYYTRKEHKLSQEPAVQIELYYEGLCPACRQFLSRQLFPTWLMLADIMNITLVPYGNAEEKNVSGKWEFDCQHGPDECFINTVETCLMFQLKDILSYFPIIFCMEVSTNIKKSLEPCLAVFEPDLSAKEVLGCVNGDLGNKLMHQNAQRTAALNPPHKYVPWIVVNGKHNDSLEAEAQSALFHLVCDLYTGPKPDACSGEGVTPLKRDSLCLA